MHPLQLRAALATPGKWRDALVSATRTDGSILLADPFEGTLTRLWNSTDQSENLRVGDPVSWHPLYGVLGAGELYLSVALLAA